MTTPIPPVSEHVTAQIEALSLDPERPLLICDADEVLLQFVAGLEAFLETQGLVLHLDSFRLHGNIKHADSGETAAPDLVSDQLKAFYARSHHDLAPVDGAAEALRALAPQIQIVILTNVALDSRSAREANLAKGGMAYPVVANEGLKGPAIAALLERAGRPVLFIDDLPPNIASARQAAPDCICIHYVADPRLAGLVPQAPGSQHRAADWPEIARIIQSYL